MKRNENSFVYLGLVFFLIMAFSLNSFAQDKQPGLEAEIKENRVGKGEAVQLNLVFRNNTNALVTVFDADPERSADINIKNDKGKELSLTKEGRERKFPDLIIRRESVFLEPGQELHWKINLSDFFDINHIGDYETIVKITYNAESQFKKGEFETNTTTSSNKVKFRVIK